MTRGGERCRLAENRDRPGFRHIPSRVAKQRPGKRVARARAEPAQRSARTQRMQQFGGLALFFFLTRAGGHARDALEQRLEGLGGMSQQAPPARFAANL